MVAAVEAILESKANGRLGPGAAALARLAGGTGFRGDEMAYGAGSAPPPLNINGADTYQFVMGNPVGGVDPLGLWRWYEPWKSPILRSTPVRATTNAGKYIVSGSELCGGAEALIKLAHVGPFVTGCENYDLTHDIDPFTYPLWEAINNINNGHALNTLPPAEQKAVHDWVKRAGY